MYLFKLEFSSFMDICPGVGLLDHTATLLLVFWETSILFSIVSTPIYIPTKSIGGFLFSTPSSSIYCLSAYDFDSSVLGQDLYSCCPSFLLGRPLYRLYSNLSETEWEHVFWTGVSFRGSVIIVGLKRILAPLRCDPGQDFAQIISEN